MKKQHKLLIENYIKAKDTNKPHLMKNSFKMNSSLEIFSNSKNISFPAKTTGLSAISKVLVQDFNKTYENVYTICFEEKSFEQDDSFGLRWLVAMNDRDTKELKIGFGTYIWSFEDDLVSSLDIRIDQMNVLEESFKDEVIDAISKLPYPWCKQKALQEATKDIKCLDFLDQVS